MTMGRVWPTFGRPRRRFDADSTPDQPDPRALRSGHDLQQYLAYIASPESLRREATGGAQRRDYSGYLRERYQKFRLTAAQSATLKWLAEQPERPSQDPPDRRGVVHRLSP